MTKAIKATIKVTASADINDEDGILSTTSEVSTASTVIGSAAATDAGKVTEVSSVQLVIAASDSTTIDLQSLTNSLGESISLVDCRGLVISNKGYTDATAATDSLASISVGGAVSNPFSGFFGDDTDVVKVFPANTLPLLSFKEVRTVSATAKDVLITNDSATEDILVEVVIYGNKA